MRRAAKVDQNQSDIVAALRKAGCYVEPLHMVGGGCPDLFVARGSFSTLMEIKMPGEKLNDTQQSWHVAYLFKTGRRVPVVHSVREALEAIGVELFEART